MKALSLWQPWASLVALGLKRFETRSWQTSYRGPLLIHACQRPPADGPELAPLYSRLASRGYEREALPRGQVIAVAILTACESATLVARGLTVAGDEDELEAGDFSPMRFAWRLEAVARLEPRTLRGARGLFEVSEAWLKGTADVT